MATLDNVNLFAPKDPKTGKTYQLFDTEAIKQKQEQSKQNYELIRQQISDGNIEQAYEGFSQLPFMEQMAVYMTPGLGNVVDAYEAQYFGKLATKEAAEQGMKTPQEIELESLTTGLPPSPFRASPQQSMFSGLSGLAGVSSLIGIGELPSLVKGAILFGGRKLGAIPSATDMGAPTIQAADTTGGGGIGGLPEPKPQPALDDAGYKSSVLEEAKAVEIDSGQALLDYLTSPKRQNPSNNKNGVALKKSEIDEIDFDAFKEEMNRVYPAGNFEKEELLEYIDDNRIQLYRVRRSENPDIRTDDAFVPSEDVDFYLDEPLSEQIYDESVSQNYDDMSDFTEVQKVFFIRNFGPEGIVTPETYQKYLNKSTTVEGKKNLREVFESNLAADSNNPFYEVGEGQLTFTRPDGTIVEALSATNDIDQIEAALNEGFTIQPKVTDKNLDIDDLIDRASMNKAEFERTEGLIDEAYRYVGNDNIFEIIGNSDEGYRVRVNGEFDFDNFDENMSFAEAELQVGQYIDREYGGGLGNIDNPTEPDDLINLVPEGVIKENQSLPTKYSDADGFRLPMGGATDYEEYTIHIKNPKTTTRYKLGTRDEPKHFGGGDELFHLRTTLRTDENGKKVLFVEEIQSDLHSTARSTQSNATYELPPKERQKTREQLNNIFQDLGITGERTDTGDFIFKNKQGENQSLDADNLPFIARYIKEGRTENFGSKNANDFVETFGLEKTQEIGDMLAKLEQGQLPDFPYKKDWVDMAVKEAMKIGVEKGADRVAFVNAPTQIARNNKNLIYVQDKIIKKMPTKEELINTPEFKGTYEQNLRLRYEDYINRSHDTNQPIPTQEEFYASIPKARKRIKEINQESSNIAQEMKLKYLDDVRKFKQQYPDSSFVEQKFASPPSGFEFETAYRDLADAEIQILSKRMNDAFDITSDPRNVDITNPALARMLDADLNFREIPTEINDKFTEIKKLNVEKDYLDSVAYSDKEQIKEVTQAQLINDLQLNRPFRVEDVGYALEGDEILNPQRTQLVGDDYDEQRINLRRLTNEDELLEEIPEKFREQVKKDLAAGKKEITLNIDDLEGSGKKFFEIYKNEIPRGINKVLKDLKVKDVKPDISNVLYSNQEGANPSELYDKYLQFMQTQTPDYELQMFDMIQAHSAIGIDLTDEMKRKIIQEGLPSMYMGGKVTKSKSMDRPIEGNRREM
jgi:uncharacterized short protein YbdD (DUF466 family)